MTIPEFKSAVLEKLERHATIVAVYKNTEAYGEPNNTLFIARAYEVQGRMLVAYTDMECTTAESYERITYAIPESMIGIGVWHTYDASLKELWI